MEINYLAVLVCAILALVIGSIWYGPLFGKKWMEWYGPKDATPEQMKEMQKKMVLIYFAQFLLALLEVTILALVITGLPTTFGIMTVLWIYIGFIVPIIAGAGLWVGDSYKVMIQKFFIQAGYHFVFLIMSAYILTTWL
jgi:hypothetical protein